MNHLHKLIRSVSGSIGLLLCLCSVGWAATTLVTGPASVVRGSVASYRATSNPVPPANQNQVYWSAIGGKIVLANNTLVDMVYLPYGTDAQVLWDCDPTTASIHSVTAMPIFSQVPHTLAVQLIAPVNEVAFAHADLQTPNGLYKSIIFDHCATNFNNCVTKQLDKAQIQVGLDLGDDYEFGKNAFSASVKISVVAYSSVNSSTPVAKATYTKTLQINQQAPEQVFTVDFTPYYDQVYRYDVRIVSYSVSPIASVTGKIRLKARYVEQVKTDVVSAAPLLTLQPVNPAPQGTKKITFNWTTLPCANFSNYEVQLLRLYNTDPANANKPPIIKTLVDWTKALSIETLSPATSLTLALVEGNGYYAWRVRPIGNYYPGGMANNKNWGDWTTAYPQNASIMIGSPASPFCFFYNQSEEGVNWIYARSFTESNEQGTQLKEQISYANGLSQVKQTQTFLPSQNNLLVNQTIQDFSGRSSLTTMAAPVAKNYFQYIPGFAKNGQGKVYTANDFDANANYKDPAPLIQGPLATYFSDNNPDKTVPDAQGYAFTRSLFSRDGENKVLEQAGVGATHRLRTDVTDRTVKTTYASVADDELNTLFGDEAPKGSTVIKKITTNPNKTKTVEYVSKDGQMLATCLSYNNSQEKLVDPLDVTPTTIVQYLDQPTLIKDGTLVSKPLALTEPTAVQGKYLITPKSIAADCGTYCTTCEYKVTFYLKNTEDGAAGFPKKDSLIITPTTCNNGKSFPVTIDYGTLPEGSYVVEKKIVINNINPKTGQTYLSEAVAAYKQQLEGKLKLAIDPILQFSKNDDLDGLNAYLTGKYPLDISQQHYVMPTDCAPILIPNEKCPVKKCPPDVDFAQMLIDRWKGDFLFANWQFYDFFPDPIQNLYTTQKFNALLAAMQQGTYLKPGTAYTCDSLYNAWFATVESFRGNYITALQSGKTYDPLQTFLDYAGRKWVGVADKDFDPGKPGYRSHGYAYMPSALATQKCINAANDYAKLPKGSQKTYPNFPQSSNEWKMLYGCGNTPQVPQPPNLPNIKDPYLAGLLVMDSCRSVCESRRPSFKQALIAQYLQDDHYVYTAQETKTDASQVIITDSDIACTVDKLVAECQKGCNLTIVTDPGKPFDPNNFNKVVSVGTDAELQAMGKSMTYTFELHLPTSSGQCPSNAWTQVGGSISATDLLANYLNSKLKVFKANLGVGGSGWFDTYDAIVAFNPMVAPLDRHQCQDAALQVFVKYEDQGVFSASGCDLFYDVKAFDDAGTPITKHIRICNWICKLQDCPAVCFRWKPFPTFNDPDTLKPISCAKQSILYIKQYVLNQQAKIVSDAVAAFQQKYVKTCLDPNVDTYSIGYKLAYYQYTLYYYDRAGHLIKTVPPKGVKQLNPQDASVIAHKTHPAHELFTEYEYNSLGQLVLQKSPDGGETRSYYNNKGQVRFSQNARQLVTGTYSYVKYDFLERVNEAGESNQSYNGNMTAVLQQVEQVNFPATGSQKVITLYSLPTANIVYQGQPQRFLLNRVSQSFTDEDGQLNTINDQVHTYYSYDSHGNVEWVAQQMPEIGTNYVGYEYDLLTSKVLKVSYNPDRTDRFFHRFTYDADGRVLKTETSRDNVIWDRDASYAYAAHGPLRRMVIGEDKVQGLDYVYTIQGWLKAINEPGLRPASDPGQDGIANSNLPQDVFGTVLAYFAGDFKRTGSALNADASNPYHLMKNPLYEGNIASVTSNIEGVNLGAQFEKANGYNYRYDELGRIKKAEFASFENNTFANKPDYGFGTSYDPNGNFVTLNRQGYQAQSLAMDNLTYTYYPGTNRLKQVTDQVAAATYGNDLDNQSDVNNYTYDATGNLIGDKQEGISNIRWGVNGKVKEVLKTNGEKTVFTYDAFNNRVRKTLLKNGVETKSYFYINDAHGKLSAMYEKKKNGAVTEFYESEVPVYGADRIGLYKPMLKFTPGLNNLPVALDTTSANRWVDKKQYELQDHLGNVRVVISDVKRPKLKQETGSDFRAIIAAYNNYDPFGAEQPGRIYASANYRYGYNGKEKDDEIKGSGNSYDYGARFHDPRVGRFLSLDPLMTKFPNQSPYVYAANNPVYCVDEGGKQNAPVSVMNEMTRKQWENLTPAAAAANEAYSKKLCYAMTGVAGAVVAIPAIIAVAPEGLATVGTYLTTGTKGMVLLKSIALAGTINVVGQTITNGGDVSKNDIADEVLAMEYAVVPGGSKTANIVIGLVSSASQSLVDYTPAGGLAVVGADKAAGHRKSWSDAGIDFMTNSTYGGFDLSKLPILSTVVGALTGNTANDLKAIVNKANATTPKTGILPSPSAPVTPATSSSDPPAFDTGFAHLKQQLDKEKKAKEANVEQIQINMDRFLSKKDETKK